MNKIYGMPFEAVGYVVDFAKNNGSTTAFDVGEIPPGFVVAAVAVEQLTTASSASAIVIKAKTLNAQVGSNVTLGASSAMTKSCVVANGDSTIVAVPAGDTLTVATASGTLTAGKVSVTLLGYRPFLPVVTSASDNKAPVDPYTPPEKR